MHTEEEKKRRNEAVSITYILRMKKNICYLHNLLLKKSNCLLQMMIEERKDYIISCVYKIKRQV
jgi:hypothetical protein